MPRWSLNTRRIYDPDEPTPGDYIDSAANALFTEMEARRAEENEMAQAGAERIPGPGVKERLGGIREAFNKRPRWLGGRAPQPTRPRLVEDEPVEGSPFDEVPRPSPSTMRSVDTGPAMSFMPVGEDARPMRRWPLNDDQLPGTPGINPSAQRLPRVTVQGAPDSVRPRPSISSAIGQSLGDPAPAPAQQQPEEFKPITIKGRGGDSYRIDPLREQRLAVAGSRMKRQQDRDFDMQDEQRKVAAREAEIQRTVEAAVRAGMPREEAEVRARTNTFRYDEEFGQRIRPGSTRTIEDQMKLETFRAELQRATNRLRIAQQQGANREAQEAAREIARINAEIAVINSSGRVAGELSPSDPIDRRMAGRDSAGAERVRTGDSIRGANTERLGKIGEKLDSIAGKPRPQQTPRIRPDSPADPTANAVPRNPKLEQQRRAWDAAAKSLRAEGKDPVKVLGKRP